MVALATRTRGLLQFDPQTSGFFLGRKDVFIGVFCALVIFLRLESPA
jgi:hypothetical protein